MYHHLKLVSILPIYNNDELLYMYKVWHHLVNTVRLNHSEVLHL